MAQKFIINKKRLVLSAFVKYHRELAEEHSETRGGGFWHIDDEKLYLYGCSGDFGFVDKDELVEALGNETNDRFAGMEIYFSKKMELGAAIIHNQKIK